LDTSTLEVAILDASRPRRAFRRVSAAALESLLPALEDSTPAEDSKPDGD
jgi:proteasome alpha subunit